MIMKNRNEDRRLYIEVFEGVKIAVNFVKIYSSYTRVSTKALF